MKDNSDRMSELTPVRSILNVDRASDIPNLMAYRINLVLISVMYHTPSSVQSMAITIMMIHVYGSAIHHNLNVGRLNLNNTSVSE